MFCLQVFQEFGEIDQANVVYDRETGRSRYFACACVQGIHLPAQVAPVLCLNSQVGRDISPRGNLRHKNARF